MKNVFFQYNELTKEHEFKCWVILTGFIISLVFTFSAFFAAMIWYVGYSPEIMPLILSEVGQ